MKLTGSIFTLLLLAALAGSTSVGRAQERAERNEAASLFANRCSNCHTVPDLGLRVDRAWLDSVRNTT